MKAKINTSHEIRKSLSVLYFELTKKGLVIDYAYNGVTNEINLEPLQSCALLKAAGLIDSYENGKKRDTIFVSWDSEYNTSDHNGHHIQQCKTAYGTFEEFVINTSFSQYDSLMLAIQYERNRQERELVKKVSADAAKEYSSSVSNKVESQLNHITNNYRKAL